MNEPRSALSATGRLWRLLPGVALALLAAGTIAAMVIVHDDAGRRHATIPAGTTMLAALDRTVSTKEDRVGDEIQLEITEPVRIDGDTVVPAGAVLHGEVTYAKGGGRIAGAPALTMRFTTLDADGEEYRIETQPFRVRGKSDALESAGEIGGGAVAGGILGGILGGGSGAAKGAVAGAALGTGVAIATDGDEIILPLGATLRIELTAPLAVTYRAPSD